MNPKSVASLGSGSPDYLRCRLEGYPLKTRYPESASELQQWCPWDATAYSTSSTQDDEVTVEVTSIADTLVFQLISGFLKGSEHQGATVILGFQPYKYRNSQYSLPPDCIDSLKVNNIARRSKMHLSERAVVVDLANKPVVWATGEIVPCGCSFSAGQQMHLSSNAF